MIIGRATSTTSAPINFKSPKPLTIPKACAEVSPPATGVPVPGA